MTLHVELEHVVLGHDAPEGVPTDGGARQVHPIQLVALPNDWDDAAPKLFKRQLQSPLAVQDEAPDLGTLRWGVFGN